MMDLEDRKVVKVQEVDSHQEALHPISCKNKYIPRPRQRLPVEVTESTSERPRDRDCR